MSSSPPAAEGSSRALPHVRRPKTIAMPEQIGVDLRGLSYEGLVEFVLELGGKKYRADQLFRWIHRQRAMSFDEMTNLSKDLRESLKQRACLGGLRLDKVLLSRDGTRKLVFSTMDGYAIESVLIPAGGRMTQCVSSQVGCRIGCTFCLTATMPVRRDLRPSEILSQIYHAQAHLAEHEQRVTNLVYMGMGEPLDNLEGVTRSCELLMDSRGQGFGSRRITVSTSGLVPGIRALGERLPVLLAVSLNATTDAVRDRLIPINRKYDLEALLAALREFPLKARERITLEYVLLDDVNDSEEDAHRLARLVDDLRVKVNLIPFNPYEGALYGRPEDAKVDEFGRILRNRGVCVTVRQSRGQDIGAACGMLDGESDA